MRHSTGLKRALSQVTLLLQLLLPTGVSIADARIERDATSARAVSHVESKTSKDCPRAHKADCALCQHVTTPFAKATKPPVPPALARCELPAVTFRAARSAADVQGPSFPRAPPAA